MKRAFTILFALGLVLAFSLVATTPVAADTHSVPSPYGTIQAAIDAATSGDTVLVAAGTYTESILIQKPLTIVGAGAGTTFIDQSGNSSAGTVVTINNLNGNVALSGFTIKTGPASTVASNGIYVGGSSLTGGTITISDCVIRGWQAVPDTAMDNYCLIAGYLTSSSPKLVFTRNTVYGGGDNPVLIEKWAGPTEITNNQLYQNAAKNTSSDIIFMMNYASAHNNQKQLISGNTFDMGWGTTYDNAHRGCGISVVGEFTGGTGPGGYTNVEISNNTFVNLKPSRRGIGLWNNSSNGDGGNIANAVIKGNAISNAPGYTGEFGIRILGKATGTTMTQNVISGVTDAVKVQSYNGYEPSGTEVHWNSLLGSYGLNNPCTNTVNATCNWWGAANGPGSVGPGSGSNVTTNVYYNPWLTEAYSPQKSVTPINGGTAYFSPDNGNVQQLTAVVPPTPRPAAFPYGMFRFQVCCLSGSTVTLNITLPGPVQVGAKWWKYQGGKWYSWPIGSDNGDNIIQVTLTDNALGQDADPATGNITDDGGIGTPGAVGWETHPVSKVRVLLPWIALFAAIAAGVSLLVLRRRRAQS